MMELITGFSLADVSSYKAQKKNLVDVCKTSTRNHHIKPNQIKNLKGW